MRLAIALFLALSLVLGTSSARAAATLPDRADTTPQLQELQQSLLQDEQTMALIRALQDDPQLQAILADPVLLQAVLAGDTTTLLASDSFKALLNNEKIREIVRRSGRR